MQNDGCTEANLATMLAQSKVIWCLCIVRYFISLTCLCVKNNKNKQNDMGNRYTLNKQYRKRTTATQNTGCAEANLGAMLAQSKVIKC